MLAKPKETLRRVSKTVGGAIAFMEMQPERG
jgi:hypothetical protein